MAFISSHFPDLLPGRYCSRLSGHSRSTWSLGHLRLITDPAPWEVRAACRLVAHPQPGCLAGWLNLNQAERAWRVR